DRVGVEDDALRLELRARRGDVVDPERDRRRARRERHPERLRREDLDRDVPRLELVPARRGPVERKPENLAVEPLRPLLVLRLHGDEVDLLDAHDYPTEPSIWSWISRFISTAYSSGSSFVIGSTNPETIIALASASERPRLIR